MEIYIKIFEVIFPVFFVIGVGYYIGKKNPKFDTNFITNFAGNIGTPAMIFYTVTTTGITLSIFTDYFMYAVIMIGGFAIIGLILLVFLKKDLSMELPPLILPNTGNMGVPICLFAYGTKGLGVASAIALILHSIFLGVKFDYDLYKLFRRVIMLMFIVFEIVAQAYLVIILYSFREKLVNYINPKILKLKIILV